MIAVNEAEEINAQVLQKFGLSISDELARTFYRS